MSALAALLTLSACASLEPPAHVARPGYRCSVGSGYERGGWANVTLDANGRQVDADWEWRGETENPGLWVIVRNTIHGDNPLRPTDGHAIVSWARPLPGSGRALELRMELTSDPATTYWYDAPFADSFARLMQHSVMTRWADLAAFARGASSLTVVMRDRRGTIVDRAEIDPALFARAAAEIGEALATLRTLSADFRNRCQMVDDVSPQNIVVT